MCWNKLWNFELRLNSFDLDPSYIWIEKNAEYYTSYKKDIFYGNGQVAQLIALYTPL